MSGQSHARPEAFAMSEQAGHKSPFVLEKSGSAIVARWQTKVADEDDLKALIRAVNEAAGADPGAALVVLDLVRVSTMPSLTLGLVMQMFNGCKARGQKLKLAGLQSQIRQVFAIT